MTINSTYSRIGLDWVQFNDPPDTV